MTLVLKFFNKTIGRYVRCLVKLLYLVALISTLICFRWCTLLVWLSYGVDCKCSNSYCNDNVPKLNGVFCMVIHSMPRCTCTSKVRIGFLKDTILYTGTKFSDFNGECQK